MAAPALYGILKLTHILAATFLMSHWVWLATWKAYADRSGDAAFIAQVQDRIFRLDRTVTGPLALVAFVTGYVIIRPLGFFGGRIALNGWAIWGLILFFVAILAWQFAMKPLEVRLADLADEARDRGENVSAQYRRATIYWLGATAVAVLAAAVAAALMVFKPALWPQV